MKAAKRLIKNVLQAIFILLILAQLIIITIFTKLDISCNGEIHKQLFKLLTNHTQFLYRKYFYTITKDKYGRNILSNKFTGDYYATNEYGDVAIDPVEYSPKYLAIKNDLDLDLAQVRSGKQYPGKCHIIWGQKKKILKEKYGIDWKSIQELNPWVLYD